MIATTGLLLAGLAWGVGEDRAEEMRRPEVVWTGKAEGERAGPARAVAFSTDGKLLAAAIGKEFAIWEAGDGSRRRTIREPGTELVGSVAFSPDGAVLATGRAKPLDETGRLWRASDGGLLRQYKADRLHVTTVAFDPRGDLLATSGYGNGIRLWHWADGSPLRVVGDDVQVRFALAFSPDGRRLAAAAVRPHSVRVWGVDDGRPLLTLEGHTDFVNDVAFSPDGLTLASCSSDGTAQLHRARDGSLLRTLGDRSPPRDRSRSVNSLAFSPDGLTLWAAGVSSSSGLLRAWRVADGTLLLRDASGPPIHDVAVSPSGHLIATARDDGTVVVARD
ncbi:MAG TPA: WD40 repeat domain-containing protein [Isosphaeraceae bacterium]|jgi:WD40 repeat protein|nr:WD40 repeat domain-containing protein [Isosphaeraceae bacterium]